MSADQEVRSNPSSKKKIATTKPVANLKRVDTETAKLIQTLKEKANKKQYGRSVRDSDIIAIAIKLVTNEHIKELQEATLSENDKLRLLHEEYQKGHGRLTLDQFIGKLIRGELASKA